LRAAEFSRRSGQSGKVAALQKRAKELAATMAKPLLLQAEFGAMRERLHMPPALAGEEASSTRKIDQTHRHCGSIRPLEWNTEINAARFDDRGDLVNRAANSISTATVGAQQESAPMQMSRFEAAGKSARAKWSGVVAMSLAIVFAAHAIAQAPAAAGARPLCDRRRTWTSSSARSHCIPTISSPLSCLPRRTRCNWCKQIVSSKKRKADPKLPVDEKWDDAVKSLLNYPTS